MRSHSITAQANWTSRHAEPISMRAGWVVAAAADLRCLREQVSLRKARERSVIAIVRRPPAAGEPIRVGRLQRSGSRWRHEPEDGDTIAEALAGQRTTRHPRRGDLDAH